MLNEYDSTFYCTYKNVDDDDLYRIQYLQAFKLDAYNEDTIMQTSNKLFYICKDHFNHLFTDMRNKKHNLSHVILFFGNNYTDLDLFSSLFCMDVFQEFHSCLCEILNTNSLSPGKLEKLNNVLFL